MIDFCYRCKKYPTRNRKGGLCKSCHNADSRARYHANLEESRKYGRDKKARLKPDADARRHPLKYTYEGMVKRCYNPSSKDYHKYGGRGIRVCDEWLGEGGFETFSKYVGTRPGDGYSIDRYPDRNGNYEPGNVRWATAEEQNLNTRATRAYRDSIEDNSPLIDFNGVLTTLKDFSESIGIPLSVCKYRYAMYPDANWILFSGENKANHVYRGHRYSLTELQIMTDLPYELISNRINDYGWSVEATVNAPPLLYTNIEITDPILDELKINYNGVRLLLSQLSELENIPLIILKRRATFGTNAEWLLGDYFPERQYLYKGHNYSRLELCLLSNLSPSTFTQRMNKLNWSVEKAVDTPTRSNL